MHIPANSERKSKHFWRSEHKRAMNESPRLSRRGDFGFAEVGEFPSSFHELARTRLVARNRNLKSHVAGEQCSPLQTKNTTQKGCLPFGKQPFLFPNPLRQPHQMRIVPADEAPLCKGSCRSTLTKSIVVATEGLANQPVNIFAHSSKVPSHFTVWNSNNLQSITFKKPRSFCIILFSIFGKVL